MTIHDVSVHEEQEQMGPLTPARALRRSARRVLELLQSLEPARIVPLPTAAMPATIGVVCVYRARNARFVTAALRSLPSTADVRLWALDDVAEELRDRTVGVGPGGRTELLNELVRSLPTPPGALVLMDDDIRFVVGSIPRLVQAGLTLGLDVFQPGHSMMSHTAFPFVRKRALLFARETTFVEQGPVVVMSPRAQQHVLPLPEELVMGWGVEVRWHAAAVHHHLRLGIIDAVAIRHDPDRAASGHTYDTEPEQQRLQHELERLGLTDIRDLQRTVRSIGTVAAWRMRDAAIDG